MQLVPLSTDGRVTVVVTAPLPSGPLRVALRMDAENVVIEALGPTGARRVGRFTDADAAAYRPVVDAARRSRAGGHLPGPDGRHGRDPRPHPASRFTGHVRAAGPARPAVRGRPPLADAPGHGPHDPAPGGGSGVPVHPAARAVPTAAGRPSPTARRGGRIDLDATGARRPASRPAAARAPVRPVRTPDDAPPRLTRDQRRRVLWATIGIAAALLLASVLQHSVSAGRAAESAAACAEGSPTCDARTPS